MIEPERGERNEREGKTGAAAREGAGQAGSGAELEADGNAGGDAECGTAGRNAARKRRVSAGA